jgi:hypothetical protein
LCKICSNTILPSGYTSIWYYSFTLQSPCRWPFVRTGAYAINMNFSNNTREIGRRQVHGAG